MGGRYGEGQGRARKGDRITQIGSGDTESRRAISDGGGCDGKLLRGWQDP